MRVTLLLFLFGTAFAVGLAYAGWALVCRGGQCPTVAVLDDFVPRQTSKVFAADGRFVAEIGIERRTLAKIGDIPPIVKNAFLVTEDKRFYKHSGIDWVRVPSAIIADLKARSFSQGFSTITMQLARNIFPERISRDKNLVRKLKEAKVARAIEDRYPKDKILELYLNQIYLGSGAHGVETAAQRYFGKSVKDLNLAEAATLAALPKGPNRYDPRRFPDRAVQRRNTIIELMRREGLVSDADASLARAYPLTLANKTEAGELAPYFVEWVRQQLDQQFGQQLYEQGLKVYTTLDLDLQSAAERAMESQLRAIESGRFGAYKHTTYEAYLANAEGTEERGAANSPYLQGAFIAMDPRTGAVRALVGGRDFDDSKFNRATQALRQPGSTFKPIVYADAIQNGRPPTYPLDDSPLTVPNSGGGDWTPQNFDGKFEGRIPLRRALYMSRNVPTIRLGMELGEQSVIDMARKFGISSPLPPYPSIHIGAADVYPIEMVSAYTAFASLGTRAAPLAILRVENQKGDVLWAPEQQKVAVMSQEEAWLMVDIMKDVVRRGTAAGSVGSQFGLPAGGKTGTTNDGNDVWFVGYTSDLVAGVWMGFDRPEKIKGNAQGGVLAAPAWTAFMREAYRRKPAPPDWPRPAGIVSTEVDISTNLLRSPYCPAEVIARDYFIAGTEPTRVCDVHNGYATYDTLLYPPGTVPPPGAVPNGVQPSQPYPGRGAAPTGTTVFTPRPPRDSAAPRDTNNPFAIPPRRPPPRDTTRPRPDTTRHDTLRTSPRAPRP
ncbi:MAG: penicillin-binding protein family [Gemmatimonadetes bacterium]|nr:penicillin-binding protein family [Gemmatimonadota bacterium]